MDKPVINIYDRKKLADCVPLEKPFVIRIAPCCVCNFQCEYCTQSRPEMRSAYLNMGNHGMLEFSLFQKIVDEISYSFGSVNKIVLCGLGEPLLNPQIAEMVRYISEKKAAHQTELITNGVLLSQEMSEKLINSGLSLLRVSVNGLSDEDYLKHCKVKVDFAQYVNQIQYFYANRGSTKLYVKIMNYMVHKPEMKSYFYKVFTPISDIINVEYLRRGDENIDYESIVGDPDLLNSTQYGTKQVQSIICPDPYYTLQFDEDGRVLPCCEKLYSTNGVVLGDIHNSSLYDIWTKKSYAFQKKMLDGAHEIPVCKDCMGRITHVYPEDVLDGAVDRLRKIYETKVNGGS